MAGDVPDTIREPWGGPSWPRPFSTSPPTRALLDRLQSDAALRRICGWEAAAQVPDETIFSRAFAEFARSEFPQRVHAALIEKTEGPRLVGHISRDATAIKGREKPVPKPKPEAAAPPATPKPRRKAGEPKRPEQMTRLERQCSGDLTLAQMVAELPRVCDVGCKTNSNGHKYMWVGYKLHLRCSGWPNSDQLPVNLGLAARQPGGVAVGGNDGATRDQLVRSDGSWL